MRENNCESRLIRITYRLKNDVILKPGLSKKRWKQVLLTVAKDQGGIWPGSLLQNREVASVKSLSLRKRGSQPEKGRDGPGISAFPMGALPLFGSTGTCSE